MMKRIRQNVKVATDDSTNWVTLAITVYSVRDVIYYFSHFKILRASSCFLENDLREDKL